MEEQNPWWSGEEDYAYEQWMASEPRWVPALVGEIPLRPYSLHFLQGPRQVGKTTAIKLLIKEALKKREPRSVFYYSCDELADHRELGEVLDSYISARDAWGIRGSLIFLDEVTMVPEWWRAVKARTDRGVFTRDVVTDTGSQGMELGRHKEYFPGRRGRGRDFMLPPLSFGEYVGVMSGPKLRTGGIGTLSKNIRANSLHAGKLRSLLNIYLKTGGFPLAVRNHGKDGKVPPEIIKVYLDGVRGDWGRVGRSDGYMKEILAYLLRARGTPVSWNGISSETSVGSPNTVRTYVETLEGLFAALVLPHLSQDGRVGFRKNRKVHFTDPMLYQVFSKYCGVEAEGDAVLEATVASHLSRHGDVFYWKNAREVDVVLREKGKVHGFEVTRGLKKARKPSHMASLTVLDRETGPLGLASL